MNTDLDFIFKESVTREFHFLVTGYSYNLVQDSPWYLYYQKGPVKIVTEFDGRSFGCWIERENLTKSLEYAAISVKVISKCFGYIASNENLYRSKVELILDEVKTNSTLIRRYCLDFVRGDFSKWNIVVDCIKGED